MYNNKYSKLDSLFAYYTLLIKINPNLMKYILDKYASDSWWVKVYKQILENKELGFNQVIPPFVVANSLPFDSNPYF